MTHTGSTALVIEVAELKAQLSLALVERDRAREALAFYADFSNWENVSGPGDISVEIACGDLHLKAGTGARTGARGLGRAIRDSGKIAKAALKSPAPIPAQETE